MIPTPSPRRVFLLVLAATLLLQTAWILALPAYRGIDEFDHVYKAEAVAHGQLFDNGAPENGRGGLVEVPEDVVVAASAVCKSYDYTGPDNCKPVEHVSGDTVTVASGAATYNPTYYAVVGLMAQPFSGAGTDFAIRAFTALMAALLLAWAAVVTSGWARNGWPMLALLVSATPVLIYSTTIASPNGVGYAAGCLLWAAGLGLVEQPGRPKVAALTTAAVTMMATHSTGVMWVAFVVGVIALLQPLSRWRALFRRSARALTGPGAVIGLAAAACVAWVLLAKTNSLGAADDTFGELGLGDLVIGQVLWALHTVARLPHAQRTSARHRLRAVAGAVRVPDGRRHQACLVAAPPRSAGPADPLGGGSHDVDRAVLHVAGSGLARPLRPAAGRRFPCTGRTCPQQSRVAAHERSTTFRGIAVCAGPDNLLRRRRVDGGGRGSFSQLRGQRSCRVRC